MSRDASFARRCTSIAVRPFLDNADPQIHLGIRSCEVQTAEIEIEAHQIDTRCVPSFEVLYVERSLGP